MITEQAQEITSGNISRGADPNGAVWLDEYMLLTYPVIVGDTAIGVLEGSHLRSSVNKDLAEFAAIMEAKGAERSQHAFFWIAAATLLSMLGVAGLSWIIANNFTQRVRALKQEVKKLSAADYDQPLRPEQTDELGDLARVFHDMRDQLHDTTISRDYLDNVLDNMNEAIVITSGEGLIVRVNNAMLRMLHFTEEELLGKPLAELIDVTQGGALTVEERMEVPREAFFLTKEGAAVPVSYTGSTIAPGEGVVGRHIYAAQNTTERRRAEQRIRYLARIDALTKVPNRMQFQHLLQRAIARARRSQQRLSLLYIDIDHF